MYKKLLLICLSAIAIQTAKAQTQKGSQMLGLGFGFSTSSSNYKVVDYSTNILGPSQHSKYNTYSIGANYSYFVADNLDFGFSAAYGGSKQDNDGTVYPASQKSHGFNGALYLRKYVLYENKIGIRTGPYVNYNDSHQSAIDNGNPSYYNSNTKNYSGGVGLDFVYFPVKKLGLMARLGDISYSHQKMDGYQQGTSNGFNVSFVNAANFSVNYIF